MSAISVQNVSRSFGKVKALSKVSLEIPEGTVFALLGPNGAGKTTLIRILTTLLLPDEGKAAVGGYDVTAQSGEVRKIIGLAGQAASVDENLTGQENLEMVGRLYRLSLQEARSRAQTLLAQFDLLDSANRVSKTYSGGMRRRLDLAASLTGRPRILFLDEPTTGLDPSSRLKAWEIIRSLVREGTTILLTTQYLEEADQLANRIGVINHGQLIAEGTAGELKSSFGGDVLELHLPDQNELSKAQTELVGLSTDVPEIDHVENKIRLPVSGIHEFVEAVGRLDRKGVKLLDIALRRPTLDEVFLSLTSSK